MLIIDGTYSGMDINLLSRAGWDFIFYFDETKLIMETVNKLMRLGYESY